jgi:hypothetical protein
MQSSLWQRLRADETSIKYLLFAVGIVAWLLTTGGMQSTPDWIGLVANGALVVLVVSLVARAYKRLRRTP